MTERLYLEDSHLPVCRATVVSCVPVGNGYDIVLDRSVFFPNAGGQPCDIGAMATEDIRVSVLGCDEQDGELVHHCSGSLPVGETATLQIDWARRFDLMQQHTGEHMLSWAASVLYGAVNVGFHLNLDYGTIDLNIPLTLEQVRAIEAYANAYIQKDLPVTAEIYETEEAVRNIPLRKQAEGLTAPIRVVTIEGADSCTCCAPHCYRTGEIGPVFFSEAMSYKGGTRLTFLCGKRALTLLRSSYDALGNIAKAFSTARADAEAAVARQQEEFSRTRAKEKELAGRLRTYYAKELQESAVAIGKWKLVFRTVEGVSAGDLRPLASQMLTENALVLLFLRENGKVSYLLMTGAKVPLDTAELAPAINAAISGKGGGRNGCAQGSAPDNDGTTAAIASLEPYFTARLKAAK